MGELRIVWEMEKPKNLHVPPTDMNWVGGGRMLEGRGFRVEGEKGGKIRTAVIALSIKYT